MNILVSIGATLLTLSSPGAVRIQHDLAYASGGRGRLDVYAPKKILPNAPIAVFLYGGSWQSGEKALYRFVGVSLASRGIVTIIPDYRVYPEVRYPDFLRDNAQAVAFAKRRAADWGADPRRLFLIGHSAGAYNAIMLALDPRWLGGVGMDPHRDIAGAVGLAGPYDFLPLRDPKLKIIFGPEATLPDTQPINHVDGSAPPLRLLAGDHDTVVDPGNATRLAAAISARGGAVSTQLYPGLGHVTLLTAVAGVFRHRAPVLDDLTSFVRGAPSFRTSSPVAEARPVTTLAVGA
jgi:acetyl esterase/lipase